MVEIAYPGVSDDAFVRHLRTRLRDNRRFSAKRVIFAAASFAALGALILFSYFLLGAG